ncbi:MAG TPA: hypothetical protein VJ180_06815, partial [Pyrinomonadaceae bacterium]|nr:hypothetical protein [Pyrinomonadaceae bacterium]
MTPDGGAKLRVGLDLLLDYSADGSIHPSAEDREAFRLQILNEQGVEVKAANSFYTVEMFLCFNRDLDGDTKLERDEMCETWRFNDPLCEADPSQDS